MSDVDPEWVRELDAKMKHIFAIDHGEAGMSNEVISRYANLPPRKAVLAFGEDYGLQRIDGCWLSAPSSFR